jgi:hypothetical protein
MEILFVAGMDKSTFPIGWQPLNDPNEFLLSQEVQFSPPQGAEPRTELRICGGAKTPVLWTPSPRECKDAGDKKKNRRPPCH